MVTTGALGKLAADVLVLTRTEITLDEWERRCRDGRITETFGWETAVRVRSRSG
jgi:hypothetical protein